MYGGEARREKAFAYIDRTASSSFYRALFRLYIFVLLLSDWRSRVCSLKRYSLQRGGPSFHIETSDPLSAQLEALEAAFSDYPYMSL